MVPGLEKFLDKRNIIAVVGVSANQAKWGHKIHQKLKSVGFHVYPINPKHNKISGEPCFPDLKSLPTKPDLVLTIVPPKVTGLVVKQCKELGIKKVWMQPGSESKTAMNFCAENGIEAVCNVCFVLDGLKQVVENVG